MGTGRPERWAIGAAGVGFLLLAAAAGWSAWNARFGVPAGATVTDADVVYMVSEREPSRFGLNRVAWRTRYRFTDAAGTVRNGSDLVPVGQDTVRLGHPAPVWYTDGEGRRSGLLVGVDTSVRPWDVRTVALAAAAMAAGGLVLGLVIRRWVRAPVSEV